MNNKFAQILKNLRLQEGLTQPMLAEKLRVSQSIISLWENGVYEPTAYHIVVIAKFFHVTTDELLDYEQD